MKLNTQQTATSDQQYGEVWNKKDIDGNLICQIFLREGYTITLDNMEIVKDGAKEESKVREQCVQCWGTGEREHHHGRTSACSSCGGLGYKL